MGELLISTITIEMASTIFTKLSQHISNAETNLQKKESLEALTEKLSHIVNISIPIFSFIVIPTMVK